MEEIVKEKEKKKKTRSMLAPNLESEYEPISPSSPTYTPLSTSAPALSSLEMPDSYGSQSGNLTIGERARQGLFGITSERETASSMPLSGPGNDEQYNDEQYSKRWSYGR